MHHPFTILIQDKKLVLHNSKKMKLILNTLYRTFLLNKPLI